MAESTFKVDGGIEAVGVVTGTSFKRVGGSSVEFLKADGSVDVGTYKTTDTNTTYSISAADHTANKKLLRLNDGSSNNDIILAGGDNITLSRTGDEVSIAGTDTTYDLDVIDGSGNKKNINLVSGGSGIGSTSFVLNPGNNISFTRTGNEITITGTDTNTNTTYTYAAIDGNSADEKILRLTSSGAVDDDITLVAGSNISLNRNNERITFTGTDTNTTYSQSAVADGSGNVNIRLTAGGSGSGDDDILITAGSNITIDSIGPNGFRIAADDENDTLISVTNRGNTTTNSINIGDLTAGIGTFTGALTVGGNLTVNGTQTIINSNTLQIGDSQVLLNKDETGTPSQNAGINVERGTSANVLLRWNETNDKWEFTNDGTTYQNIPTTNTTYGVSAVDGDPNKKKIRLSGVNPSSTDDVTLAGGTGITLTRSTNEITITNSAPDTDTTYSQSVVDSGDDVKLRLTNSSNVNDDITVTAGSNITLTHDNASEFTISGVDAFPSGGIIMWSGAANAIPSGWVLCNGQNSTPDLRGKFVVGYSDTDNDFDVNDTGGSKDAVVVSHTHDLNHNHTYSSSTSSDGGHSHTWQRQDVSIDNGYRPWPASNNDVVSTNVQTSTDGDHGHNISGNTGNRGGGGSHENRPPFYALCYIMKT